MKNRVLQIIFWTILIFISSCSEDDVTTVPIELKERVLNEIITREYKDGEESNRIEEYFLSGKQYLKYTYEGNTLVAKVEYKYNSRGSIERIKYYYNDVFEEQDDFIYDTEGRLIEFYSENRTAPEMAYYREFEYPGDSTILEQQKDNLKEPLPGGTFVYSLNELNLIKKIESEDGKIFEADYEENQIISVRTPSADTYNYTYDEINLEHGDFYKKYFQSIYGREVNNAALSLSSLLDIPMVYADKFLLTSTSENSALRYEYVIDDEGFPIERDIFYNDMLTSKTTYAYE
ncbi:hypothetical protein QWY87_05945 [Lutimonas halocynthiae]|uniref:hypothetical protein n=1 Tax=Lutimonas halocynthiae TaxID=1446477 RepID=UPI0025B2AA02|nr:hypothetical protein [Lutimonas halocynthiae]MDN3642233.1 hypothetical protein [Lutimonas halocynthiae]